MEEVGHEEKKPKNEEEVKAPVEDDEETKAMKLHNA
jgi:hypothetical protein